MLSFRTTLNKVKRLHVVSGSEVFQAVNSGQIIASHIQYVSATPSAFV